MKSETSIFQKMEKIVNEKFIEAPKNLGKILYGFLSQPKQETKGKVDLFLKRSVQFNKELAEKSLQPLAILPYETWEKICHTAGLIRFENLNTDGITYTNSTLPDDLYAGVEEDAEKEMSGRKTTMHRIYIVISAFLPTGLVYYFQKYSYNSSLLLAAVFAIFFLLIFWVVNVCYFDRKISDLISLKKKEIKSRYNKTVEDYFPSGIDKKEWRKESLAISGNNGGREKVRVSFKLKLPVIFESILQRATNSKLRIMVAADTKAISVDYIGISDNYTQYLFELEEERKRQAAIKADPILYVTQGNGKETLVAILAQCGDFPNEDLVLEYLRNEYSVINLLS